MSCGIYKIENLINGKTYIGQSIRVEERWRRHKYDGIHLVDKLPIHRSINKYGIDNFSFEIIEELENNQDLLDEREIYWIAYYNTQVPNGYNISPGGSGGAGQLKGIPIEQYDLYGNFIAEYPSAMRAADLLNLSAGDINACANGKRNHVGQFQWKWKNSEKMISDVPTGSMNNIKIYQYNLKGELIKNFDSLQECAKFNNISKATISNACKRKKKSNIVLGKYIFIYEYDLNNISLILKDQIKNASAKSGIFEIQQIDIDTNEVIATYDSISDAGLQTGINTGNIGSVISPNNNRTTTGGYKWKRVLKEDF